MKAQIVIMILAWLNCGAALADPNTSDAYAAIFDKVLQANADAAVAACHELQQTLNSPSDDKRHTAFVALAQAWTKVRASYVLGGYDMAAMDYPLLIAYFHVGKEDLHESLEQIVEGTLPPASALYKNSYKTLRALDDVMFSGPWLPRREQMAGFITGHLCKRLAQVSEGYRAHRGDFLADPEHALSLLINAEIESLYKTRDWRIAQIIGLTKKSLGQQQPDKQEYPYSQASWPVIGAIIAAHEQLLAEDRQPNIATIAHARQAGEGLILIQKGLSETARAYQAVPPDKAFDLQATIPVFQGLLDTQKAFYRHLVGRIGVTASIIDADGD